MMHSALLVAIMAAVTILLRALPFLIFSKDKEIPPYLSYLGSILPQAVIAMLVIYCLKDVSITAFPFGLPELISLAAVILLQVWKRNSLISILGGTILYMFFVLIFSCIQSYKDINQVHLGILSLSQKIQWEKD